MSEPPSQNPESPAPSRGDHGGADDLEPLRILSPAEDASMPAHAHPAATAQPVAPRAAGRRYGPAADGSAEDPARRAPVADGGRERLSPWRAASSSLPVLRRGAARPKLAIVRDRSMPEPEDASAGDDTESPGPTTPTPRPWPAGPGAGDATPAAPAARRPAAGTGSGRRRAIALIGIGVLGLAVLAFVLPQRHPVAAGPRVASVLGDPQTFDGRKIRLAGVATEIHAVGQGHLFNLGDGDASVAVFTMRRPPREHARVTILGRVSVGYLDGVARVCIFEEPDS